MRNAEIALHFDELADLYELDGAIVHRVLAYRNAAKAIREATASVEEMTREGTVTELPGRRQDDRGEAANAARHGHDPVGREAEGQVPARARRGHAPARFRPKKARKLFDALGVASLDDLRKAVEEERLRDVPGFGPKAEENVRAALEEGVRPQPRPILSKALEVADSIVSAIREHPGAERVELAGSARRWADSCKDLDIVATATDPEALAKAVAELPLIGEAHHVGRPA